MKTFEISIKITGEAFPGEEWTSQSSGSIKDGGVHSVYLEAATVLARVLRDATRARAGEAAAPDMLWGALSELVRADCRECPAHIRMAVWCMAEGVEESVEKLTPMVREYQDRLDALRKPAGESQS
jgi:hypothetical protein